MTKQKALKTPLVKYWIIMTSIGLACLLLILWAYNIYDKSNMDAKYSHSFTSRGHGGSVRTSQPQQQDYHPPGLRESSIHKLKGNHYDTF